MKPLQWFFGDNDGENDKVVDLSPTCLGSGCFIWWVNLVATKNNCFPVFNDKLHICQLLAVSVRKRAADQNYNSIL